MLKWSYLNKIHFPNQFVFARWFVILYIQVTIVNITYSYKHSKQSKCKISFIAYIEASEEPYIIRTKSKVTILTLDLSKNNFSEGGKQKKSTSARIGQPNRKQSVGVYIVKT